MKIEIMNVQEFSREELTAVPLDFSTTVCQFKVAKNSNIVINIFIIYVF